MLGQGTVTIGSKQWVVDIATSITDLSQGLSGVASIPANTGMLFDVGVEQIITVNAVSMLFPLSVIFINANSKVTGVAPLLSPGDTGTASIPARYFLEVNVGEAAGINPGDDVVIVTSSAGELDMNSLISSMLVMMMVVMMMKAMTGVLGQPTTVKPVTPIAPARPVVTTALGPLILPERYEPVR